MASIAGRGAQVILDGDEQKAARGRAGTSYEANAAAKAALELAGLVSDGSTPDGSSLTGVAADDPVLGIDNGGSGAAPSGLAALASPAFTGTPTAPTATLADSTTTIATTAFVKGQGYAPLASPTFTGTATFGGSVANKATLAGNGAGFGPTLQVVGTDTNVSLNLQSKGSGVAQFIINGGVQFIVGDGGGAANRLIVTGSGAGFGPILGVSGTDTDAALNLQAKGAGRVVSLSPFQVPGYLFASLPSVGGYSGCVVRVTDRSSRLVVSDGTNWRFMDGVIAT